MDKDKKNVSESGNIWVIEFRNDSIISDTPESINVTRSEILILMEVQRHQLEMWNKSDIIKYTVQPVLSKHLRVNWKVLA